MGRHVVHGTIALCLAMLVVGGMTSGCIFKTEPTEREWSDTAGDAGDTGDVEPVDADSASDAGDADDASDLGIGETCLYDGLEEGVCTEGTKVSADAGGVECRAPVTYRDEEVPSEDVCDGLDNDCDGIVDEGCTCDFNQMGEGICPEGTVSAEDGHCIPPDDYATDETSCDGVDNDCDGVVDEGCRCLYRGGDQQTGVCEQGRVSTETGECEPPEDYVDEETGEHCDAKDNDCDGEVDEPKACDCEDGETESCYTGPSGTAGTGICSEGTRSCNGGTWGACDDTTPADDDEACADDGTGNDIDEDCDGITDEGCRCIFGSSSDGVCSEGKIGSQGNCKAPSDYEQDESTCDGKDNDCDGIVDENCPCDYDGKSDGVCGDATVDPGSGDCAEPGDYEQTESSCDSKDNDCDGDVDGDDSDLSCDCNEGDEESCYAGPSGTAGTGICKEGTRTCQSDGTWGDCKDETTPASSPSNGEDSANCGDEADNDCDGTVDDGCTCVYDPNEDDNIGGSDNDNGVCTGQTIDDSGKCTEPSAYDEPESICDDTLDNDCDGDADCADADCDGKACGTGTGAICQNGGCVETSCGDGDDNDNDGKTDCSDPDCAGEFCEPGGGQGALCDNSTCVETACGDGNDNDDDGSADDSDAKDCRKTGLASCLSDSQCVSGTCASGDQCAQSVAVTTKVYSTGDLGGLSGADTKCNDVMSAELPGEWKAIVSTSNQEAIDRLTVDGPVYNTNGAKVAGNASKLWSGSIDAPIEYDESGTALSNESVWTGTLSDGTVDNKCGFQNMTLCTCGGWTSASSGNDGGLGDTSTTSSGWVDDATAECDGGVLSSGAHLYCIDGQQ